MQNSPPIPESQSQQQYPLPEGKVLAAFIEQALKDVEIAKQRLSYMHCVRHGRNPRVLTVEKPQVENEEYS